MTVESFNEIWKILEEKTTDKSESGVLTRRIFPSSHYNLYLGFEKPSNRRILQVKISKENVSNASSISRSKGVELRQIVFSEDLDHFVTIELVLTSIQYQDIFTILSYDIVNQCIREGSEKEFLRAFISRLEMWQQFLVPIIFKKQLDFIFISRLEMWQQFLEQYGPEGLSTVSQRGLYGELRFLRDFLIPLIGAERALSAWRGPYKAQQDFQLSGIAIEVKTGAEKLHQRIQISSEQQLDDTGMNALYLYHISLREINNYGETLPGIIDEIRGICDLCPRSASVFEELLFRAGYLEEQRKIYEGRGYTDRSLHIFNVIEGFPRIIENDLASGVGDVHYSINLSSCMPFNVNVDEFRLSMKRYFDGH